MEKESYIALAQKYFVHVIVTLINVFVQLKRYSKMAVGVVGFSIMK